MNLIDDSKASIRLAAEALRAGELVVVPTETVYGLACDASNTDAIRKVFKAKGRPTSNPLIAHVTGRTMADQLVEQWTKIGAQLAEAFWPGPMTLVLQKRSTVSDLLTADEPTIAVRCPAHPVFFELIREFGGPVAAPSANSYTRLSPTSLTLLEPRILESVAYAIDGGPCQVGIESTVVDCTGDRPIVLRPGMVSAAQIAAVVGSEPDVHSSATRRSPGTAKEHYRPSRPVRIVHHLQPGEVGLSFHREAPGQILMPMDAVAYARRFYAALAEADLFETHEIRVEAPPKEPEWAAIWDRLSRAATASDLP